MTTPAPDHATPAQRLAASARPLAEVLVDALRRDVARPRDDVNHSGAEPGSDQLVLCFDDEFGSDDDQTMDQVPFLQPVEIAAAVLLGHAFDQHRPELARLQDSDAITLIEVPTHELIAPIVRLVRAHIVGAMNVASDADLRSTQSTVAPLGTVAIFRDGLDDKARKSTDENAKVATAVQRRCAIIAVSAEPHRLLPEDLVSIIDTRIIVPSLDGAALGEVIAAVTGRHPGAIGDALAARVTLTALNLTVRADLGAECSLARLKRVLDAAKPDDDKGPLLSEMYGLGPAKDWSLHLAADLRAYAAGKLPWSACPKGLLLTSPPGMGKTTFARALAREAGVHFIATSYAQWQSYKEGHLGNVTQAIRNVFAEANRHRPCIVFIDEIDTMPARGSTKRHDDWWTAITNTILEAMDGYERREGVVVIAACNDPSRLDPALTRAGRLDRRIDIPLPDVPALTGIFRTHLKGDLPDADLRPVALAARGNTGADVERFVREAKGRARRQGGALTRDLLLDIVRDGTPDFTADVRWRVSRHEAGHAIASIALRLAEPVSLSITHTGGLTDTEFRGVEAGTRGYLERHLIMLLAGRAAEELIEGEASAGSGGGESTDLARATWLATQLETVYGLGHTGLVWLPGRDTQHLALDPNLQAAVGATLDKAYAKAKELLTVHRRSLDALAAALFETGYLDREEIKAVLRKAPLGDVAKDAKPAIEAVSGPSLADGNETLADSAHDASVPLPAAH